MNRPEAFLSSGGDGGPGPGYSFPAGVAPLSNTQRIDWMQRTVRPLGQREEGVTLPSLLPSSFADYARILHPGHIVGGDTLVRWAEVAKRTGRTMHPQAQWGRLAGTDDPYGHPEWAYEPEPGRLPAEVALPLVALLRRHTKTSEHCLMGIWEGYGSFAEQYPSVPRMALPDRTYLMFVGPVEAVAELASESGRLTPNIWWPADRAWCIATEIDFLETYVGGSASCVEEILSCPDLETFRVSGDARVDFFADTINTLGRRC